MTAEQIMERIGPAVLLWIPHGEKGPRVKDWQKMTLSDMTPEFWPKQRDGAGDGTSELITCFFGFWSVSGKQSIEHDYLGGTLNEPSIHSVERTLGRTNQEAENQRGHRRNEACAQFYRILRFRPEMVLRQKALDE
jgi:hypothetical protein